MANRDETVILNPYAYGTGGGGGGSDPYWSSVVALLHFDGADASTTFTDETGLRTWTAGGNAQIDTASSVFGGASGLFDGTGDYISTPAHADFDFGSGNFTIEMWVTPANLSGLKMLAGQIAAGTYAPIRMELNASNYNFLISATVGGPWVGGTTTLSAPATGAGTADHVAFVRNGSTFTLYVNGVSKGTRTHSGALYSSTDQMRFGATNSDAYSHNGWIDEARITKGVARYTANFTPPTAAFPNS